MATLLLIIIPISLLDSTSMVPFCIIPLATILGGSRPVIGAASFLAGIFVVYAGGGILFLVGLDALFDVLGPIVSRWWNQPNTLELLLQVVVGGVMLGFGWKLSGAQQRRAGPGTQGTISPGPAFTLGAGLTVAGLPGALPYFGAIDQILRAELGPASAGFALLVYNLVFLMPLAILLIVRLLFPAQSDTIFQHVASFADRWGRQLIMVALMIVGAVLVADGVGWLLGYPLLPVAATQ